MLKNISIWLKRCLTLLFACSLTACVIDDIKAPEWDVNIFGPLANASAEVNDFLILTGDETSFGFSVFLSDLQFPIEGTAEVPCSIIEAFDFNLANQMINYDLDYGYVVFSGASLNMVVTNGMGFDFASLGLTVRSGSGEAILTETITNLLRGESTTLEIDLSGKRLATPLFYDITFDASCNEGELIAVSASDNISVSAELTDIAIQEIGLEPTENISFTEDASINLEGDNVNTPEISGTIRMVVTNQLPVALTFSTIFTNENGNVLETLFVEETIAAGENGASTVQSFTSQEIDTEYYERIKNASFVRTTFDLNVDAPTVVLGTDSVGVQFIGDIIVNVDNEQD